jgi:hypothetical protein
MRAAPPVAATAPSVTCAAPRARVLRWPWGPALILLLAAVAVDRLSIPFGGLNLRVELLVAGLLAAAVALWRREAIRGAIGPIEICLAGWVGANAVASALFSPQPGESLKYTVILAGLLVVYMAATALLRTPGAAAAAVAWVAVGLAVTLLGLGAAILNALTGSTAGILLERFYRDGVFIVTPKVQSTLWEPNIFGSYSLALAALAFGLSRAPQFAGRGWAWFYRLAIGAGCAGVMLSMTRTVWLVGPVLLLAVAAWSLRRGLVGRRTLLSSLLIPATLGFAVGLGAGQSMHSVSWRTDQPWTLSYEQVERITQDITSGRGAPALPLDRGTPAPGATPAAGPGGEAPADPALPAVAEAPALFDRVAEALSDQPAGSVASRARIYGQALAGWLRRPALGWGAGAFPFLYPPPPEGGYWIANLELHALFDSGIVGLLCLAGAFGLAARGGLAALRTPAGAWTTSHYAVFGLLAGGAGLLAAYQITDGTWLGFTWVWLALLVAAGREARAAAGPA